MKYLPYEKTTYTTRLTTAEAIDRIREGVEPKKMRWGSFFGSRKDHKPYEGYVYGNTFAINRIIHHRNSFLPQIKGQVEDGTRHTQVQVEMSLAPVVLVFLGIWCGLLSLLGIGFILGSIKNGALSLSALIPLGMLLFGYGLCMVSFKSESRKAKKYLAQVLEADLDRDEIRDRATY